MTVPKAVDSRADAVVAGAGLIGLAIAWRAASAGMTVSLVDPLPGRGASWAAGGMLAPVTEVHFGEEPLLELNLASSRAYPGFVADVETASGLSTGYLTAGTLVVARDPDDNAALEQLFRYQQELGLDVQRLRAREVRALEPSLAANVRGGILCQGDHRVDNRALVDALCEAARRASVRFVTDRVDAVEQAGGQVTGVHLASGAGISSSTVVIAAGAESAQIAGIPSERLPVRPVKGQLLHLRGPAQPALLDRTVRGLEVYIVPRADGRLIVGATMEERGFDTTATAGAVHELLRRAYELVPGITELDFTEVVAGLRPGTPDNAPLLGPAGPDGLLLATGHFRNGVLLTPVTADVVLAYLKGTDPSPLAAAFAPTRFAAQRAGYEPVAVADG